MKKINEIIIVEGIHDISFLSTFIDAYFIQTHGSSLPKETIDQVEYFKSLNKEFIILTDPDYPGEKIRNRLLEIIPNAKICFIEKSKAKTNKKVGVEHSNKDYIIECLEHLVSYSDYNYQITNNDLIDLGLNGTENSNKLREKICYKLHIGKCNSKQFLKRINLLNINKDELENIIKEI